MPQKPTKPGVCDDARSHDVLLPADLTYAVGYERNNRKASDRLRNAVAGVSEKELYSKSTRGERCDQALSREGARITGLSKCAIVQR